MMKISKRLKNFLLALGVGASSLACVVSSTLAWIETTNTKVSMGTTAGYTQGAYFARGRGTADDPYILNAPVHLYNLAWLQEMGKFNVLNKTTGKYEPVYFEMEADIDATGSEYRKIPPIGTSEYPFIGNFNGAGHTISGVKTCNKLGDGEDEILRKPSSVSDISHINIMGIFGVVGSYDGNPSNATYNSQANEIKNFNIKDYTIVSSSTNLLVGAVAGYVNAKVDNVVVSAEGSGVTFDIGSVSKLGTFSNISDYGLVGYATTDYRTEFKNDNIEIYNNYVSQGEADSDFTGNKNGWGGSVTASGIYQRLSTFESDTTHQTDLAWENKVKTKTSYVSDGNVVQESTTEYTDEELKVGATQWEDSNDPLKGKVVYGSESEDYLYGSVDRPDSKGYTEITYTLGGSSSGEGGGSEPGEGGGETPGGGDPSGNPGGGADAEGHPSFYIAPTTDPTISYQYVVASGWNFDSPTTNKSSATTFARDDDYLMYYQLSSSTQLYIGNWNASNNADISLNTGPTYAVQDWGKFLRLTEKSNPNSNKKYYLRYNGSKFVLTGTQSQANVVYLENEHILRIDPTTISSKAREFVPSTNIATPSYRDSVTTAGSPFATTFRADTSNLVAVARYFCENPSGPSKMAVLVSARDEGSDFRKESDNTVSFYASNWSQWLRIGYWDINNVQNGSEVSINQGVSVRFKVESDNTLRLYNSNTATSFYLCHNGTSFVATNNHDEANVKYEANATKGDRLKVVVYVEPGSLGEDDWTKSTSTGTYDETVGATYLPLNVYSSTTIPSTDLSSFWNDSTLNPDGITPGQYSPTPSNNAYIIGGTKDHSLSSTGAAAYNFKRFSSSDGACTPFSLTNGSASSYQSSQFDVITVDQTSGEFTFIKDDYNSTSITASASSLSHVGDWSKHTYGDLGLERYKDARDSLNNTLASDPTNSYFMRFNGVNITKDRTVVAGSTLYNQHIYSNLELPESCIDFRVQEDRGVFNMFASGYREGSECSGFASFYQIFRDNDEAITEIKRISQVYTSTTTDAVVYKYFEDSTSSTTADAYYQYSSGSYTEITESALNNAGYSLKFDMSWIENPGFTQSHGACYYFEWPISGGEYALASTPSGTESAKDGYIFYIGVGAPAEKINRTQIFEKYVKTSTENIVAKGVYFVDDLTKSHSMADALAFKIKPGFEGTISVVASGDETIVIEGYQDTANELNYKRSDFVFKKTDQGPPIEETVSSVTEETVETLTYIDLANNGDKTKYTVTETRTVTDGVSGDVVRTGTMTDSSGNESEYDNVAMKPHDNGNIDTVLFKFYYVHLSSDTVALTVTFELADGSLTTGTYYVTVESEADIDIVFYQVDNDTYAIYLNGVEVTTVSTVTVTA